MYFHKFQIENEQQFLHTFGLIPKVQIELDVLLRVKKVGED